MKIVTWNVNSVRARQERLLNWLKTHQPDVLCLQELKCVDKDFPTEAVREAGYHSALHGQKTYNGVAILAKSGFSGPLSLHVEYDVATEPQAEEAAMLAAASKDLKFLRSKLQEVYGAV